MFDTIECGSYDATTMPVVTHQGYSSGFGQSEIDRWN